MPFWVGETFSANMSKEYDLGDDLARSFQRELIRTEEIPIVEIFHKDRSAIQKGDYRDGNYQALMFARAAGYDLLLLGELLPPTDAGTLVVNTKVINVESGVTLWAGQTTYTSYRREQREMLGKTPLFRSRPELFDFAERIKELAECTVHEGIIVKN